MTNVTVIHMYNRPSIINNGTNLCTWINVINGTNIHLHIYSVYNNIYITKETKISSQRINTSDDWYIYTYKYEIRTITGTNKYEITYGNAYIFTYSKYLYREEIRQHELI